MKRFFFQGVSLLYAKKPEIGNEFSPKSLSFQKFLSSSSSKQHNFHVTNWRLKYRHLKSQEIHLKRKTPKKNPSNSLQENEESWSPIPTNFHSLKKLFISKGLKWKSWNENKNSVYVKRKQSKSKKRKRKTSLRLKFSSFYSTLCTKIFFHSLCIQKVLSSVRHS